MQNFSVKVDGKEHWISRSVAVVGFIFRHNTENNTIEALVEKRGDGAADFQGRMCVPCGYLDYNESGEEAISREAKEECGVVIPAKRMQLFAVDTRPSANRQNISLYYTTVVEDMGLNPDPKLAVGGEKDEVAWAKWMTVAKYNDDAAKFEGMDILKNDEQWAFGHNNDIETCLRHLFDRRYKPTKQWRQNLKTLKVDNT